MSRAEDTCAGLCRPFGLTKCDSCRPSFWAAAFISPANASTEPDTPSATVTATSFGDFTISIFSALSSVTSVPGLKPILDGCWLAARAETTSGVFMVRRPARTASRAT